MKKKIMLLGSGELGKEFVIACKRKGQYVVACDKYAGAPAMQVADECRVFSMLDGDALAHSVPMASHVDIVGAGPAGLWAALHLLRRGFTVDLYEQGKSVEERFRDIRRFFAERKFIQRRQAQHAYPQHLQRDRAPGHGGIRS